MGKKHKLIVLFCILSLCISTAFISKKAQSTGMASQTGAPSEGTCNSCHGGGSGAAAGITITAVPAFTANEYVQGQTYTINISVAGSAFNAFGFDCEILATGTNLNAGTMQNPGTGVQLVNGSFGRKNATHTTPKTGTGAATFNFEWVAPTTGNSARIYVAAIGANLSGSTSGDFPMSTSLLITTPTVTAISENNKSVIALSVYPNPAKDNFRINYQLRESNTIKAQLMSVTGQLIANLVDEKQEAGMHSKQIQLPLTIEPGVYFLKLFAGSHMAAQRLIAIN